MEVFDFSKVFHNSDQILVVENKDLHVHRCVLSMWSPYFQAMFNSNFKEKDCKKIELTNKVYEEIVEMLRVIYDRNYQITGDTFEFLLALADEYQMEMLKNLCKEFINNAEKNNAAGCLKFLHAIHRYNLNDIKHCCDRFIKSYDSRGLRQTQVYSSICQEAKIYYLETRLDDTEKKLEDITTCSSQLLEPLYKSAFEGYRQTLTSKNFPMRSQSYAYNYFLNCENAQDHKMKKQGQYFDSDCPKCRRKISVAETIEVLTSDVSKSMNDLKNILCIRAPADND